MQSALPKLQPPAARAMLLRPFGFGQAARYFPLSRSRMSFRSICPSSSFASACLKSELFPLRAPESNSLNASRLILD
jgi:hypothetical protein